MSKFKQELAALINRHSIENESNTPDFLLAGYLINCLDAYQKIVYARDEWFGITEKTDTNTLGDGDE